MPRPRLPLFTFLTSGHRHRCSSMNTQPTPVRLGNHFFSNTECHNGSHQAERPPPSGSLPEEVRAHGSIDPFGSDLQDFLIWEMVNGEDALSFLASTSGTLEIWCYSWILPLFSESTKHRFFGQSAKSRVENLRETDGLPPLKWAGQPWTQRSKRSLGLFLKHVL